MHLLKLIRTASPEANLLASLSASALVFKIVFLNTVPQIFPGAHELGVIFEAILASVVASYIFYLIVVHVKEQEDKIAVNPYISKHIKSILTNGISQLKAIEKASKISLNIDFLDESLLSKALSEISPYSDAPLILTSTNKSASWIQYLSYNMNQAKSSIRRLLDQLIFLDAKLVALITAIDDCSLYRNIEFVQTIRLNNDNLSNFHSAFYEYFTLCKSLKIYSDSLPVAD